MASPEIIIQLRVAPNLWVILLLRTEVIVHARVEQRFLYCAGIQTCVNSNSWHLTSYHVGDSRIKPPTAKASGVERWRQARFPLKTKFKVHESSCACWRKPDLPQTRLARCVWGDMFYLCLSQCQSKFPWLARKKAHQLAQSFILSNFLTSLYWQCQPAGVQRVSAGWITKSINTLWKQEVWEMH